MEINTTMTIRTSTLGAIRRR